MTRFARAKGSKASNERLPDEPTPWHVMKQQLEDSVASKQASQAPKTKSAKELLKERDEPFYCDLGAVNHDWAEFPPDKVKPSINKQSNDSIGTSEGKKKHKKHLEPQVKDNNVNKTKINSENGVSSPKKSKKRISTVESPSQITLEPSNTSKNNVPSTKKNKTNREDDKLSENVLSPSKTSKKRKSMEELTPQTPSSASENIPPQTKKLKINKEDKSTPSEQSSMKKKKKKESSVASADSHDKNPQKPPESLKFTSDQPSLKLSKRQKRNRKNKIAKSEEQSIPEPKEGTTSAAFNTKGNEWSSEIKFSPKKKSINSSEDDKNVSKGPSEANTQENKVPSRIENPNNQSRNAFNKFPSRFDNQKVVKKRKPPKIRDDKEHKRRKPTPGSTKVIINGMEIDIVMYDGFPVKKEDAERLAELRKQMVMKGIPKSEINAAMKLERRKAEKALARIRKNVCFHCRKAGHNLSDCPDLGKEEVATGICFKCGSTEHTHFECRVTKKEEFGFAKCFICREQGHIAKQCPDNPKGLYPQGGACKICGDVTHLKKDCPDLVQEKEESTLTLGTISEAVEDLGGERRVEERKERKQKVVTF